MKLLELANLNHPALKELIVQAPGTYHHAILMGAMVEAAAQAIGANPLLAKVCAYYHDLGKIRNPVVLRGEPEGREPPRRARALDERAHHQAARHGRPGAGAPVAAPQRRRRHDPAAPRDPARRLLLRTRAEGAEEEERRGNVGPPGGLDESLFRYPGPKPQSREAALVMIADAVRGDGAGARGAHRRRLNALVSKRINEIFSEGQLDECELTLKDLNPIAGAMVNTLEAIYHARPVYPPRAGEDASVPLFHPAPRQAVTVRLASEHPRGRAAARRLRGRAAEFLAALGRSDAEVSSSSSATVEFARSTASGGARTSRPTCSRSRSTSRRGMGRSWATW